MEGHLYARRLSKDEYRLVEDMTKKNVPPRDILSILKAQNKNNMQTIKVQRDWDSFLSAWKLLEDSPTWISYMKNYKKLQLVLRKYPRETILLNSVDIFWRTLDVSWSTSLEHEDIQCEDKLHIFKETFNKLSNAGNKSLLRRPDLNEELARHSSYVSQSFAKHGSSTVTSDSEIFLRHLPQIFHHYLTSLQDVRGDGNCGFRSVVVALGLSEDQWPRIRSDLVWELEANHQNYKYIFGTAGYKQIYKTVRFAGKWMKMPNTRLIIASAYNRVVISLANGGNVRGCTTTFPLWSSPPQSEPYETIVIAHVYDNHFIRAELRISKVGVSQKGCFVMWQMVPNKRLIELAISGHKVVAGGDGNVAWRHTPWIGYHAAQDGIQRWELDYPIGQVQSTLGLSIIKWRRDLALGFNSLAQFSAGRNSKVAVRAGINNKMTGLITIKTSSSEHLLLHQLFLHLFQLTRNCGRVMVRETLFIKISASKRVLMMIRPGLGLYQDRTPLQVCACSVRQEKMNG
nr:protein FAR-RED impaired response 1-like [Tanacetum cinerariifolium]